MLTIIENDAEATVRVHSSECRDVAKDRQGAHVFVTEVADRSVVAETVADNQCCEIEELGEIVFLPCCDR